MNHLAHIYLSFNEPGIMAGNLIGDFVRGKKELKKLPKIVQQGVHIHRKIDAFTDKHPIVKRDTSRLKENFGGYAPVAIDVYYDFCLSRLWGQFSSESLQDFANKAYGKLQAYHLWMPGRLGELFPRMVEHNWLLGYSSYKGIQFTFDRLSKRTKYEDNFDKASRILQENEATLLNDFAEFFPEIIQYVKKEMEALVLQDVSN